MIKCLLSRNRIVQCCLLGVLATLAFCSPARADAAVTDIDSGGYVAMTSEARTALDNFRTKTEEMLTAEISKMSIDELLKQMSGKCDSDTYRMLRSVTRKKIETLSTGELFDIYKKDVPPGIRYDVLSVIDNRTDYSIDDLVNMYKEVHWSDNQSSVAKTVQQLIVKGMIRVNMNTPDIILYIRVHEIEEITSEPLFVEKIIIERSNYPKLKGLKEVDHFVAQFDGYADPSISKETSWINNTLGEIKTEDLSETVSSLRSSRMKSVVCLELTRRSDIENSRLVEIITSQKGPLRITPLFENFENRPKALTAHERLRICTWAGSVLSY